MYSLNALSDLAHFGQTGFIACDWKRFLIIFGHGLINHDDISWTVCAIIVRKLFLDQIVYSGHLNRAKRGFRYRYLFHGHPRSTLTGEFSGPFWVFVFLSVCVAGMA